MTTAGIRVLGFEGRERAMAKEQRQPLEGEKGRGTDSPIKTPERTSRANTLS